RHTARSVPVCAESNSSIRRRLLRAMNVPPLRVFSFIASLSISAFATLAAQTVKNPSPPQPVPMPPPIAAPVDQPYVGPVQLEVDLTNVTHRGAHVREQIPAQRNAREPGLLYPQW